MTGDDATARLGLPLLAAGQAGKETTHNEALALVDLLVQPAVAAAHVDAPPDAPRPGQCWIVGDAPSGAWAGQARALAGWTGGGWRFVVPWEGLTCWCISATISVAYRNGRWQDGEVVATRLVIGGQAVVGPRGAAIADPAGGTVIDDPARQAVAAILVALRRHGLIAA